MSRRIRVKICGITNQDDALACIEAGADALGFNLFPGSKRHIQLEDLTGWLPALGSRCLRVAVMVNPSLEEIRRARPLVDIIQLHGQETPAQCAEAAEGGPVWKAFPLTAGLDACEAAAFPAAALVIDSFTPGAFGGTGALIDMERAALFVGGCPGRDIWLSGGLSPGNVAEAVKRVRPYGVDVASGVEVSGDARRKDFARVKAFVAAARGAALLDL